MFQKILIADDFDSQNLGISLIAKDLGIPIVDSVFYCDEALSLMQSALDDNSPYELLITDLSFLADYPHVKQKITGGEELISVVKNKFPETKIIVFSVENRSYMIERLIGHYNIDGFVTKGRRDMNELKKAINSVYNGAAYFPDISNTDNVISISENDMVIINLLNSGFQAKELPEILKKKKITPNSESYINKKLSALRKEFNAENTQHLLTILADILNR